MRTKLFVTSVIVFALALTSFLGACAELLDPEELIGRFAQPVKTPAMIGYYDQVEDLDVIGGRIYLIARATDDTGWQRPGLYASDDGTLSTADSWIPLSLPANDRAFRYSMAFTNPTRAWVMAHIMEWDVEAQRYNNSTELHVSDSPGQEWNHIWGIGLGDGGGWEQHGDAFLWSESQWITYFGVFFDGGELGPYAVHRNEDDDSWDFLAGPGVYIGPDETGTRGFPEGTSGYKLIQQRPNGQLWLTGSWKDNSGMREVWTSDDGFTWREFLPDVTDLGIEDRFHAFGMRNGESIALGWYHLRTATTMERYPANVSGRIVDAYALGNRLWLVNEWGEVWYSSDGVEFDNVTMFHHTRELWEDAVHFAGAPEGMYIAVGKRLYLHRYKALDH